MTPDLERVARAVRQNRFRRNGVVKAFDGELPLTDNEIDDARAAVAALMDVSDGVVWSHELPHVGPDEIRAHFQAMLRAVLGDEQKGAGR